MRQLITLASSSSMLPAPPRLPLPPPARLSNAGPSASAYGKTFASRRAISPSGSEDSYGSSSDDDGGTKTAARRSLAAAQKQQRQIGNQRTPIAAPMRTNAFQPQPPAISTKPAAAQSVLAPPPACSVCEMAPAAVRCSECSPASALMCPPCDADMHRPQRLSRHVRHALAPQSQPSMFRSDSQQSLASVPEEQTPKPTPTVTPLPTPTGAASAPPEYADSNVIISFPFLIAASLIVVVLPRPFLASSPFEFAVACSVVPSPRAGAAATAPMPRTCSAPRATRPLTRHRPNCALTSACHIRHRSRPSRVSHRFPRRRSRPLLAPML